MTKTIVFRVAPEGDRPEIGVEYGTTNGFGQNPKHYKIIDIVKQEKVKGLQMISDILPQSFKPHKWIEYTCEVEQIK